VSAIKMFAMLPRRSDISAQAFHDHWRHPHGTFGRRISTVRRYVQSHQVPSDLLGDDQGRYDGVVEVWFDNVRDALGLPEHPVYRDYLVPDEPRFIDMDGLRFVFTREEVIASGHDAGHVTDEADLHWDPEARPTAIKLIQLIEPGADSPEPDAAAALADRVGALRHVHCVPAVEVHPEGADFAAVRELWWPTWTALGHGVAADPAAWRELVGPSGRTSLLAQAERFL
jgi:hypothetical protein